MKISSKKAYEILKRLLKYNKQITIETASNGVTWVLLYLSNLPTLIWYEEGKYRISFPESYKGVGYPQALCRSENCNQILSRLQTYIKSGHEAAFKEELSARMTGTKFFTLAEVRRRLKRRKVKPLCFPPIVNGLVKATPLPKKQKFNDVPKKPARKSTKR